MRKSKRLSVLSALLLALFLLPLPALAEETAGVEPAAAEVAPVHLDATSEEMELWTDTQWDEYFKLLDEQYEQELAEEKRAWRVEQGLPYYDGVNVRINGEYISFADSRPVVMEDRVLLPLRAVLEALDAELDWDAESETATALFADGKVLKATVGSETLVLIDGEETTAVPMDLPPLLDEQGRVLVPLRHLGEAIGYEVAWDSYYEIVKLDDPALVIAAIDEQFSAINHLLKLALTTQSEMGTMATKSTGTCEITLYGDGENHTARSVATITGLSSGQDAMLEMRIDTTPDFLGDILLASASTEEERAAQEKLMKQLETMEFSVITNLEEDSIYFRTSLMPLVQETLNLLTGEEQFNEDTWLLLRGLGLHELTGLNPAALAEQFTIGNLIYQSTYSYNKVDDAKLAAGIVNILYGDDYFKATTRGDLTTYSVRHTKTSLLAALLKSGLTAGLSETSLADDSIWKSVDTFLFEMKIAEKAGVLSDSTVVFDLEADGAFPFEIHISAEGDQTSGTTFMEFKGEYIGKIVITADSEMTESSETLPAAPAEGEQVVDLSELLGMVFFGTVATESEIVEVTTENEPDAWAEEIEVPDVEIDTEAAPDAGVVGTETEADIADYVEDTDTTAVAAD
ncbi:MAG: copper amine oxidase N-terminal domain-containing protein [Clostridia bacterium]|nr:copper amine oxidase N-terminal domain-containing protein [Clostridia bacterium]